MSGSSRGEMSSAQVWELTGGAAAQQGIQAMWPSSELCLSVRVTVALKCSPETEGILSGAAAAPEGVLRLPQGQQ